MTPEQKVALDAMMQAWPEEVVQRMLRAENPDALLYVAEAAYALGAADARRMRSMSVEERIKHGRERVRLVLSISEKPTAQSTPQPPGETA